MKKLLLASAMAVLPLSAFAADLPMRAPAPAPVYAAPIFTWSGFYLGAQLGYGWGNAKQPWGAGAGATTFTLFQADADQKGVFGGVYGGYNFQFNSVVFGLEGDINADGIKGNDGGSGGNINGVNHNWNASIRARLGYAAFDRALIYAAGGVAFMGADATNESVIPNEKIGTTWTGWTLGAGIEYAFTNNLIGRLEYRYTDYGSQVARFPISGYAENITPRVNSILIGMSYKFGGAAAPVLAKY